MLGIFWRDYNAVAFCEINEHIQGQIGMDILSFCVFYDAYFWISSLALNYFMVKKHHSLRWNDLYFAMSINGYDLSKPATTQWTNQQLRYIHTKTTSCSTSYPPNVPCPYQQIYQKCLNKYTFAIHLRYVMKIKEKTIIHFQF